MTFEMLSPQSNKIFFASGPEESISRYLPHSRETHRSSASARMEEAKDIRLIPSLIKLVRECAFLQVHRLCNFQ